MIFMIKTLSQFDRKNTLVLLAIFLAFPFLEFVDDVHGSFVKEIDPVEVQIEVEICAMEGVVRDEMTLDERVAA